MGHSYAIVVRMEPVPDVIGHRHRPMFAAGAPDRNGEIALTLARILRQQVAEKILEAVEKLLGLFMCEQERLYFRVVAVLLP